MVCKLINLSLLHVIFVHRANQNQKVSMKYVKQGKSLKIHLVMHHMKNSCQYKLSHAVYDSTSVLWIFLFQNWLYWETCSYLFSLKQSSWIPNATSRSKHFFFLCLLILWFVLLFIYSSILYGFLCFLITHDNAVFLSYNAQKKLKLW